MSFYWYNTKKESERDVCGNINIIPLLDKYMEMCDNEKEYHLALKRKEKYVSDPSNWNYDTYEKLTMEINHAYRWYESSRDQFWFAREVLIKEDGSDESRTEKFDNVCKAYRKWILKNNYEKCLEDHHDVKDLVKYIYTDHATEKHNNAVEAHLVAHYARIEYMSKKGEK